MKLAKSLSVASVASASVVEISPSSAELTKFLSTHDSATNPIDVWSIHKDGSVVQVSEFDALVNDILDKLGNGYHLRELASDSDMNDMITKHMHEVHTARDVLHGKTQGPLEGVKSFFMQTLMGNGVKMTDTVGWERRLVYDESWFKAYHPFADIRDWFQGLTELYPDHVEFIEQIAEPKTHEGRSIFAVKLANKKAPGVKKQVYVQSLIHAREWISGCVTQWVALQLLSDPELQRTLDEVEFVIVPVANPDGYAYTWGGNRLWRKNRNPDQGHDPDWWFGPSVGVDLNRNWDIEWGSGAKKNPRAEDYPGPHPESENEVQALIKFYHEQENLIGALCLHSFSELILRPWGWSHIGERASKQDPCYAANASSLAASGNADMGTSEVTPEHRGTSPHEPQLKMLADVLADGIQSSSGEHYTSEHAGDLYTAVGTAQDWYYSIIHEDSAGKYRVPAFTIELRPKMDDRLWNPAQGFILPPEKILPTVKEVMNGFPAWVKNLREQRLKC